MKWLFLFFLTWPSWIQAATSPFLTQLQAQLTVKTCAGAHTRSPRRRTGETNSQRSGLALSFGLFLMKYRADDFVFQTEQRIERIERFFQASSPADVALLKSDYELLRAVLKTNLETPGSVDYLLSLRLPTAEGQARIPRAAIEQLRRLKKKVLEIEPILLELEHKHLQYHDYGQAALVYNPYGASTARLWRHVQRIMESRTWNEYGVPSRIPINRVQARIFRYYLEKYLKDKMPVQTELAYVFEHLYRYERESQRDYLSDLVLPVLRKTLETVNNKQRQASRSPVASDSRALESLLSTIFQEAFLHQRFLPEILAEMPKYQRDGLGPALVPAVQGMLRMQSNNIELVSSFAVGRYLHSAKKNTPAAAELLLLAVLESNLKDVRLLETIFARAQSEQRSAQRIVNSYLLQSAEVLELFQAMKLQSDSTLTTRMNLEDLAQEFRSAIYLRDELMGAERDLIYQKISRQIWKDLELPEGSSFLALRFLH